MAVLYVLKNTAIQTTAAPVAVTTGTATLKTLLQLAPKTGIDLFIAEWGFFPDGSTPVTPGSVELIETDVAATVTASASADITRLTDPGGPAADTALITLGTTTTGYTASGEGTVAALRDLDPTALLPVTGPFVKQFPQGQWPRLQAGKFGRIRTKFPTACNVLCYIVFSPSQG